MRLSTVPLTADNIGRCTSLWGGREGLSSAALATAVRTAAALLSTGRARGRVFIDDDGEVRAFGCSTFVTRACADAILAHPAQLFGTTLLRDPSLDRLVLDERSVARGNSGDGLDLLVLSQGYALGTSAPEGAEFYPILGAMMHAFVETHRGYNVNRIVNEVFGAEGMEAITAAAAGGLDIAARFETRVPSGVPLRSLCWTLTRADAQQRRSLLLPMFLYARPRLRFTPSEQALLRSAIRGCTDRESTVALGIPITAVKSRWTRIHERVADELPALLPRSSSSARAESRGSQSRHLILDYVREHPSELTPYPRARTGRAHD
jgi:hypothetical protein